MVSEACLQPPYCAERALVLVQELGGAVAAIEEANADPALSRELEVLVQRPLASAEVVEQKLKALLDAHPWMELERATDDIAGIASENASVKSKRRKVIAIANRMTATLTPQVACKPGAVNAVTRTRSSTSTR
jgi:hypothetical protein